MTIQTIINRANALSDEQIPTTTVQQWVGNAITKFDLFWPAIKPLPTFTDLNEDIRFTRVIATTDTSSDADKKRAAQFTAVNEILCDTLIMQYVAYRIKVNDASQFEYSDMYKEWLDNLKQAKSLYNSFIDELYKIDGVDTSIAGDGSQTIDNPLVAVPKQSQFVYSPENTWGEDPGAGVTTFTSVSSINKFGGK